MVQPLKPETIDWIRGNPGYRNILSAIGLDPALMADDAFIHELSALNNSPAFRSNRDFENELMSWAGQGPPALANPDGAAANFMRQVNDSYVMRGLPAPVVDPLAAAAQVLNQPGPPPGATYGPALPPGMVDPDARPAVAATAPAVAATAPAEQAIKRQGKRRVVRPSARAAAPVAENLSRAGAAGAASGINAGALLDGVFMLGPDLGTGHLARNGAAALAKTLRPGAPVAARAVAGMGRMAGVALPVLGTAALAAGPVMAAMEGNETAGGGGALVQGGSAAAGAIAGGILGLATGGIASPLLATIGAGIGGAAGGGIGKAVLPGLQDAVDSYEGGSGNPIGQIGKMLGVKGQMAAEADAIARMENSPAMKAIKAQEKLRESKERNKMMETLYMQALLS